MRNPDENSGPEMGEKEGGMLMARCVSLCFLAHVNGNSDANYHKWIARCCQEQESSIQFKSFLRAQAEMSVETTKVLFFLLTLLRTAEPFSK